MGSFFESDETESIETSVKMSLVPKFLSNSSKWVAKTSIFTMGSFFESDETESIETGVEMGIFLKYFDIFTGGEEDIKVESTWSVWNRSSPRSRFLYC